MKSLTSYFTQLSQRDKSLLLIAALFITFALLKFFVIDALSNSHEKLLKRNAYVQQQTESLQELMNSNKINTSPQMGSDQIINGHLKDKAITDKLKQIRTTSSGEKRFEIENIQFDEIVDLLNALKSNGSYYSSLQIKDHKNPGVVNIVMTLPY
jgi:type II secretory pathway component PulM